MEGRRNPDSDPEIMLTFKTFCNHYGEGNKAVIQGPDCSCLGSGTMVDDKAGWNYCEEKKEGLNICLKSPTSSSAHTLSIHLVT